MLNNLGVSLYYPINTKIHKLNPLIKIICLIVFLTCLFINKNIYISLMCLFTLVILIEYSKLPLSIYYKVLLGLKYILLFIIIIYLLLDYSIVNILIICLRLYIIVLYTTFITMTTSQYDMTRGIEMFLFPISLLGISINKISLLLTLALRYIPTIFMQVDKIMKSQKSRGIDFNEYELNKKFFSLKTIVLPIFILTLKRADQVADVLQLKLYDLNKRRTHVKKYKITLMDILYMIIHILILLIILFEVIK